MIKTDVQAHLFPTFHSSDNELDKTYNYRCELFEKHIRRTPAGYVITEFLPDVPWAGIYNTISCAAMHHFREGRWMSNTAPMYDYAHFWCETGNPRLYSFPISDSILSLCRVTGDFSKAEELYPKLSRIHCEWDDHRLPNGLYFQKCDRDGMEYSISGDGARPTINSYMYAEKIALSYIAKRTGNTDDALYYSSDAEKLRGLINNLLWSDELSTFCVRDNGELRQVRELIGYIPWIWGIPKAKSDECFRYLLDESCFLSPHGLRTADASHPEYRKPFDHECLWNGPIWPFATSQTLTAVISLLQSACANHSSAAVSDIDFMSLLRTYSSSQRETDESKRCTPYIDENLDPDTGIWLARDILRRWNRADQERGRHYNHSTFIDLVLTGLCGIIPSDGDILTVHPLGTSMDYFEVSGVRYHGHSLSIEWERSAGMKIKLDGEREFFISSSNLQKKRAVTVSLAM